MSDNVKEIIGSIFSIAVKVVIGFLVVMFIRKYAVMAYNYGYRVFTEPPVTITGEGTDIQVTIGEDNSVMEIGKILENKGLIRDAKLFFIQELANEYHGKIKPGKYELNTSMTASEMILIMADAEKEMTEEELLYGADEQEVPFKVEESEMMLEEFGDDPDIKTDGYGPIEDEQGTVEGEE